MKNNKISKTLSYILRHKPENFNIKLDSNGWALVENITEQLYIDMKTLDHIVETNDKKRFMFNENKTKIRACQGHTIDVDVELKKCIPPIQLYHGTKKEFVDVILKTGLKPMNRKYVHLSADIDTATNVAGRRKGDDKILEIQSKAMYNDNIDIFISENGVYLVEYVDPKYIKVL